MDSEERACKSNCPSPCPHKDPCKENDCMCTRCHFVTEDYGPHPYVVDIEKATLENPFFRRAIWTGCHLQLTLMCIPKEIGLEMHPNLDQFLRLEQGEGIVMMGKSRDCLKFMRNVSAGSAVIIPAGTWHNMISTGDVPIKLYSIYAPPQHPAGTVHCTKADSDAAEE